MIRPRELSRWAPVRAHSDVDAFLKVLDISGCHAIDLGGQHLDLLIEDRGSDGTVVVFHSALSAREERLPVFQGRSISSEVGVNLVAVADPSLAMGDVDLAWFLGNRFIGPLKNILVPVIEHVLAALGSHNTVVMGGSGGGYAAVLYGQDISGSTTLAMNPRLDLGRRPFAKVDQYLNVCHKAVGPTSRARIRRDFVPERVAESLGGRLREDLLVWQNSQDLVFLTHQFIPFVGAMMDLDRMYVRLDSIGPGHRPFPSQELSSVMRAIFANGAGVSGYEEAGFSSVGSGL